METGMGIMLCVAVGLAALFGVILWWRNDDKDEMRQEAFDKSAAAFEAIGDKRMAYLLRRRVYEDWSGLYKALKEIVKEVSTPEGAIQYRMELLETMLPKVLEKTDLRVRLIPIINKALGTNVPIDNGSPAQVQGTNGSATTAPAGTVAAQ